MLRAINSQVERAVRLEAARQIFQSGNRVAQIRDYAMAADKIEVAAHSFGQVAAQNVCDMKMNWPPAREASLQIASDRDGTRAEIKRRDGRVWKMSSQGERLA